MYTKPVVHMSTGHIILCICIVGMVDGCGYDSQHKYIICDAYRPYHWIPVHIKAIFAEFDRFIAFTIHSSA